MKLLFDQNISYRILKAIGDIFPEGRQVRELGLEGKTDKEIWKYAKSHHFCIVTFDADFFDMANLYGHPPKIIWIRSGNIKTKEIAALLRDHFSQITEFLTHEDSDELACLEIG